jgi:hypothetical protein
MLRLSQIRITAMGMRKRESDTMAGIFPLNVVNSRKAKVGKDGTEYSY